MNNSRTSGSQRLEGTSSGCEVDMHSKPRPLVAVHLPAVYRPRPLVAALFPMQYRCVPVRTNSCWPATAIDDMVHEPSSSLRASSLYSGPAARTTVAEFSPVM